MKQTTIDVENFSIFAIMNETKRKEFHNQLCKTYAFRYQKCVHNTNRHLATIDLFSRKGRFIELVYFVDKGFNYSNQLPKHWRTIKIYGERLNYWF